MFAFLLSASVTSNFESKVIRNLFYEQAFENADCAGLESTEDTSLPPVIEEPVQWPLEDQRSYARKHQHASIGRAAMLSSTVFHFLFAC